MRGAPDLTSFSHESIDANRFAARYRKMSDEELLRLAKQQSDLFPEAAMALNVELCRRDFSSHYPQVTAGLLCTLCGLELGLSESLMYGQPVCYACSSSFWKRRAIAHVVDNFVFDFVLPLVLLFVLTRIPALELSFDLLFALCLALYIALQLIRGSNGLSPGKRITQLEVIDVRTGKEAGIIPTLKRNVALFVPFAALAAVFQVKKGPRFGDGWAHTRVVFKKYREGMIDKIREGMARPEGFEPPTLGSEDRCSDPLS